MKKLLLFSFLLSPCLTWGQAKLDSLYAVWQDQRQPDSSRVQAYFEYVWHGYINSDPDSAYLLAEVLLPDGDNHEYPVAEAKGYLLQGLSHAAKGDYSLALDYYNRAKALLGGNGHKRDMGCILEATGVVYASQGNPTQALEFYQRSLAIHEANEDKWRVASVLNNIGNLSNGQGNYPQALGYYQRSLSLGEEIQNERIIAAALGNIGTVYSNLGDFTQALEFFQRHLALSEEIGDKIGTANALANIGVVYAIWSDYPQALAYYERQLALAEEVGDKKGIAISLGRIGVAYARLGDYPQALAYYQRQLALAEEVQDKRGVANSLGNMGIVYATWGNYPQALAYYQRCLRIQEEIGDKIGIASSLNSLGTLQKDQGNYEEALAYYQQSLHIQEEIGDKNGVAISLNNLGTIYSDRGNHEKAQAYFQKSLYLREEIGEKSGIANSLNNLGVVQMDQGNYHKALEYYQRSLHLREEIGDESSLVVSLINIGDALTHTGQAVKALTPFHRAFDISQETGSLYDEMNAAEYLYNAYKKLGRSQQALTYHEHWVSVRDSLFSQENTKKLARLEAENEYRQQALTDSIEFAKQAEIKDLQIAEQEASLGQQRMALWSVMIGLALIGALAFSIFRGKRRSDELLLNILPAETAAELKATGSAAAKEYEQVSVLFSDFIGFTQLAEQLTASELVTEIDTCFKAFDDIITRYGLEKIKTIGDAYMAAGGLPDPMSASTRDVVHASLAMQQFVEARKAERDSVGLPYFEMRVGIHTGPVIAGVVGVKKFQYDVWGDTVNTAARMESNGEVGKVNVSAKTRALLSDEPGLSFKARGAIEAKGKGMMEMYFVEVQR